MRVLVISAGRGPVECRRAVKQVATILVEEAEAYGFAADLIHGVDPDGDGPVSSRVVFAEAGAEADAFFKRWLGSVQWIARSERRSKADRKNWFVGVFEDQPDTGSAPSVVESDIAFSAMTAGGPGGQHQNKTASAVRAVHRPSGVTVVVRSERSQHRNKALAIRRIAAILATMSGLERATAERNAWWSRVEVQRGNPVRILRQE